MKKALIWITVGGLAVAGTAYVLIKQNKKKTSEAPLDSASLTNNIAQGNSNSTATSSASTLTSNAGTSQASNASAPASPLLTSQSTPQEVFDLVEAKRLSSEIDVLTKELIRTASASAGTWGTLTRETTEQKMTRLKRLGDIQGEIKSKTSQLTALGYAIQPYGGVKKI